MSQEELSGTISKWLNRRQESHPVTHLDCTFEETLNRDAYSPGIVTRNETLLYSNSSVAVVSTKNTHNLPESYKSKALKELMQTYKSSSEQDLLREIQILDMSLSQKSVPARRVYDFSKIAKSTETSQTPNDLSRADETVITDPPIRLMQVVEQTERSQAPTQPAGFFERQVQWLRERNERLEKQHQQLLLKRDQEEARECTFQPNKERRHHRKQTFSTAMVKQEEPKQSVYG